MPEMLGSDLLLEVHSLFPKIKTILLTGYSEIEEISKSIKAGISAYITKPWNEDHLLSEIQSAYNLDILEDEKRIAEEMLMEELRWGGELQKTLLKRDLPKTENIEFDVLYQPLPALFCGGDYYDIIPLQNNQYLVLLGDVAGHGLKAAFITTILKTIIFNDYVRSRIGKSFSPADFLEWLNKRIAHELTQFPDMLITFSAILIDIDQLRLTYSNAGQSHFFIIRGDKYYPVHQEGICLNISEDSSYKNHIIRLKEKDHIILLTDGLIEIEKDRNTVSPEKTGEILCECSKNNDKLPVVVSRFKDLCHIETFQDDVTLLSIRLKL
ncbi:MAG: response regulator [Spirochaetales bacterium]|nr:response regulator [Spirochaetales bacterium]